VCVLGASLDVGNRGVRALGSSVARLLAEACPERSIVFHYSHTIGGTRVVADGDGQMTINVQNCRLSLSRLPKNIVAILLLALLYRLGIPGPARRNPWLRSLLNAEFIGDIRGGDSFSDLYGFRRFVEGSLPLLSVALLGRPYVMLPQTYGPFQHYASRKLAECLLRGAETLVTRDKNCIPIVRDLCGRTPSFCPDVAFVLNAMTPKTLQISPKGLELENGDLIVGINVSGLLYMGGYTGRNMFGLRSTYRDLMDHLIDGILARTLCKVLLIPHTFGSEQEQEACLAVQQGAERRHRGRVYLLTEPLTEGEVKWLIGRTSFFVGSRMHACIAALSQGVPAVGLAYSDKFLGVFESVGVGDAIVDLRRMAADDVLEFTLDAFRNRSQFKANLEARVPMIRQEIMAAFHEMLHPATACSGSSPLARQRSSN
jgi:colanic acid/amylovoran biosynthesis protein